MGDEKSNQDQLKSDVADIEKYYNADILVFSAPLFTLIDDFLIGLCRKRNRRKNILVIMETPGGSADAAYRVCRALRRSYCTGGEGGEFILYVHRYCKSAGTILALGSDRIIMSQEAELGPIDVQLRKEDEVGERTSGLTPHQALDTLAGEAMLHFRRFFRHLRYDDEIMFSTKLAAELATSMTIGLMGPIYQQIDPLRMGEIERYVRISSEYGERLRSKNVKPRAVELLAGAYPSHGFVIDREEAEENLFHKVERPVDALERVADAILDTLDDSEPVIRFLNRDQSEAAGKDNDGKKVIHNRTGRERKRTSSTEIRPDSKGEGNGSNDSTQNGKQA